MTDIRDVAEQSPWGPDVSAFQAVTSVVSLHIADALLNSKSDEVRSWARELAYELQRERIDLRDEISRHLIRKALGNPGSEPPF